MDPHLLRTFVAVLDHRSFSTAASALGYTQSAVSQHIAALESDLGTRLVERRPVTPTPAGARLMEHVPALLLRLDAARADIARLNQVPTIRLTFACSPAALGTPVARALARLRAGTRVDVEVRVLSREAVIEDVLTARADLGLVDGITAPSDPLPLPDLGPTTTLAATEEPLAVILPLDHPLAERRSLRLPDLTQAQWIDAPDSAVPLERLRTVCRADGFPSRIRHRGTDLFGLAALAAAGHGLAALPLSSATSLPAVAAVPIRAPRLIHRTELVHPANPTAPARRLIDLILGPPPHP
ncbi:LysR family transcriptional regulator [Streptomyces sp. H27-G5]|uniref:LysR family transcriptional regulator n=1 Tax=Streptomyces sp. H27-G5 TaxID=2996698 RepID=UPI00226E9ED6|nr:LysR family transcriptional regulator [Streptomyces sp. H27-G5]MCY0918538.1 LysR family transcriptional regulator [Streptomyces sp. H27-G5]